MCNPSSTPTLRGGWPGCPARTRCSRRVRAFAEQASPWCGLERWARLHNDEDSAVVAPYAPSVGEVSDDESGLSGVFLGDRVVRQLDAVARGRDGAAAILRHVVREDAAVNAAIYSV